MAKKHNPAFLALVDAAKERIPEVDADQVLAWQQADAKLLLIDVREDREWDVERIQGAVHLGKGILERDIEGQVPDRATRIVLYCGGGFRSALAADALRQMGYTQVLSLAGGIRHWRAKEYPLESGTLSD